MVIASDSPQSPVAVRIDGFVNDQAGSRATCEGRGEGRRRPSRTQNACNHDVEEEQGSALLATHTIDLRFSFADSAPITGVKDVEPKRSDRIDSVEGSKGRQGQVKRCLFLDCFG